MILRDGAACAVTMLSTLSDYISPPPLDFPSAVRYAATARLSQYDSAHVDILFSACLLECTCYFK